MQSFGLSPDDIRKINMRHTAIYQENQKWIPAWKFLSEYIFPERGAFDDRQPNQGQTFDHRTLVNGTSTLAARTLAAGMTAGLTSPSRPWFKLGVEDPDLAKYKPVQIWLEDCRDRMMAVFAKSNIYQASHSIYEELACFATCGALIAEDFDTVIRAYVYTAGEYALGTGPDGRVNTLGRKYWRTVGQLVAGYGLQNVSPNAAAMYSANNTEQWIKVCQLIEPNDKRIVGMRGMRNMPYRSVHWEDGKIQEGVLRFSGYREWPLITPRWKVVNTSAVNGTGPGWDALGDIKQLQVMEVRKLVGLDKMTDPPLQIPDDHTIANSQPGGITRYAKGVGSGDGVRPTYMVNLNLADLRAEISAKEDKINEYFYKNLFLMLEQIDRPNMTATEIVKRHEEKVMALIPTLERLKTEKYDPLIDRTFAIMVRKMMIPQAPQELSDKFLHVDYISTLAQAQKMVETVKSDQLLDHAGRLAALAPTALDNYDFDKEARDYGENLGADPRLIRSDDEVAALREARAKEQNQQKIAQEMAAATAGAKTLSDTKLGQGSALDKVLQTLPGVPAMGSQ